MTAVIEKTAAHVSAGSSSLILAIFSLTLFVSAALMFSLQPMVGKMLLPLIGGTPAGWIVTLAFFQLMLLGGYLFAHLLSRATPRRHGILYVFALLAGAWFLPLQLPDVMGDDLPLSIDIMRLLTLTTAVPFIAISATSSTIQRLFTATGHPSAADPYFLYAASNLGSFAGLFAYPLLAEPLMGISQQAHVWQIGFMLLVLLATACLGYTKQTRSGSAAVPEACNMSRPVNNSDRVWWILLAFIPSSLLSGVTTHISTDIFSAPLIWSLPLGAYLLTFVIAFGRRPVLSIRSAALLQQLAVPLAIGLLFTGNVMLRMSWFALGFHLLAFTLTALMCHMLLAQRRPQDGTNHLTEFYLMISIGGALGGVLNAFIIPYALDRLIEYPAFLLLSLFVNPSIRRAFNRLDGLFITASVACVAAYYYFFRSASPDITMIDIGMAAMLLLMAVNIRGAIAGCFALLVVCAFILPKSELLTERNFFGVIRVVESPIQIGGNTYTARYMFHGTTAHGMQIVEKPYNKTPTVYFTEQGPLGSAFMLLNPHKVAIMGLGVGTINCYATPDTEMTFIEIDQGVVDVARRHFTFLNDGKGKAEPRIIIGDGRIEMQKLDEKFDMIILDAFSSDTIPHHLLTTDALTSYLDKLSDNGVMIMNISNRYFNLAPILTRNAQAIGLHALTRMHYFADAAGTMTVQDKHPYAAPSFWVAMSKSSSTLRVLRAMEWIELEPDETLRPWTDDYTNPIRMLVHFNDFKMQIAAPTDNK